MTYLIIGDAEDLCCKMVGEVLRKADLEVINVSNPFAGQCYFNWRFDGQASSTDIHTGQGERLDATKISGVLVRTMNPPPQQKWAATDALYAASETQAALLGWLYSLPCTVINRYSADIWYIHNPAVLNWYHLLVRAALPTPDVLVSNVPARIDSLRQKGATYTPLSGSVYRLDDESAWAGLDRMIRYGPVPLASAYDTTYLACLAGQRVVWREQPDGVDTSILEAAMHRFAALAGLRFVALTFAAMANGLCTLSVEHQPQLEWFGPADQLEIVSALVTALIGNIKTEELR